jgi:hypothetical protein
VPPRTDRERLDDRRKLLTRGRDCTARDQVRFRINGGKTAAANERLLLHIRRRKGVLSSKEAIAQREHPIGHDDLSTGRSRPRGRWEETDMPSSGPAATAAAPR